MNPPVHLKSDTALATWFKNQSETARTWIGTGLAALVLVVLILLGGSSSEPEPGSADARYEADCGGDMGPGDILC